MDEATFNNILLFGVTGFGAVATAFSVAFVIWTYNDMKARSRDPLAQIAAALVVAILNVFGLVIYVMLRPRETLADAYERSLEEEALLQEIEEKPACPGCGRPTKHHWQLCPHCHTKLKQSCVKCNELLELTWRICPVCATVQPEGRQDPGGLVGAGRRSSSVPLEPSPYDVDPMPSEQLEWVDEEH